MSKYRIESAERKHFDQIKAKPLYSQDEVARDFLFMQASKSPTAAILLGEIVLAIYGINILNGVGTIWGIVSEDVYKYKKTFAKASKTLIKTYFIGLKLRRLQLTVPASVPEREQWTEFLGFKEEGCLEKFGTDGVDHYIYGKVS